VSGRVAATITPSWYPENPGLIFEYRRAGRDWTGYEGLSVSGLDAIFDCLMDGTACITSKAGWKWDDIIWDLGMRLSDIAHQDMVIRADTTEDIRRGEAEWSDCLHPVAGGSHADRKRVGSPRHPVMGWASARRASPIAKPIRWALVCASSAMVASPSSVGPPSSA